MRLIRKYKKTPRHLNSRISAIISKRRPRIQASVKSGKKRLSLKKKLLIACAALFAAGFLFFIVSNLLIMQQGSRVFDRPAALPDCHTALVLGCSPKVGNSQRDNLFFLARVKAAAELYHSGKVKTLLLSGDNGRKGYNEPEAMRQALIQKGVPDEKIYCDYAGFSTLDSITRADTIFGQKKFIIVSQGFHCERAIFLSRIKGLDTYGFEAEDIDMLKWKIKNHVRESLARPAAIMDLCFFRSAKFGGEKIDMSIPQIKAD